MYLSALLQFAVPLTALLVEYQSMYFHGIKLHSLEYLLNILTLCWHSTPSYYAFIMLAYLMQAFIITR